MATNWNAVLANINNASDILAILRKVLGLLDGKVDLTKIDEIINDISNMKTDVDTALTNVTSALSEFDTQAQGAIEQVIAAGLMEGFTTEVELLASRPAVLKKYARAEDTDVIWFWYKPDGSADGNYWTSTGLSDYSKSILYTNLRIGELLNSPSVDIFNKTNKVTGSYINKSGAQTSSSSWSCSGFLPVKFRDIIIFNASANNVVAFISAYDANRSFLRELVTTSSSSVVVLNGQKEIESDVKFIRVSFYTASNTSYSFQIKTFELETDLLNKTETSDMVFDELTAKPNLFESSTARNGYSLVNNVETGNTNWIYSDYIPVIPNGTYTSNKSGYKDPATQTGTHFYDANHNLVSYGGAQTKDVAFSVPANAYFMRMNFVKTTNPEIGVDDIVVNQGLNAKKYGKFEEKVKDVLSKESNILHRYNGKIWIALGDSITDPVATPFTYPPIVAAHFGMTLLSGARSGSRIRNAFYYSNIVTDAAIQSAYFLTIAHGTNDLALSTPLGSIADSPTPHSLFFDTNYVASTNETDGSFYGDYKGVIEYMLSINPSLRLILATPLRRTKTLDSTGTDTNKHGLKLKSYVDAVKEIAEYYGLPCLDNYSTSGFNHLNIVALSNNHDGLHPNAWAQENILAQKFIGFFESN